MNPILVPAASLEPSLEEVMPDQFSFPAEVTSVQVSAHAGASAHSESMATRRTLHRLLNLGRVNSPVDSVVVGIV